MEKTRENNYDLLRIISAIAVIAIHVSEVWMNASMNAKVFGEVYRGEMLPICFYNALSCFAVPCFIMLSGAFILTNEKNMDYKYFYRKIFVNIGIPTLLFSLLYFLYLMGRAVLGVVIKGNEITYLLQPITEWCKGRPFYHMWYLYMMVWVYLLVPIILLFKRQVGEKVFGRAAWIFLICASLGGWTSTNMLEWDIGFSFRFVSYFMVGYEIRRIAAAKKSNKKGLVLIAAGVTVELFPIFLIRYRQVMQGITENQILRPLNPLVVLASILIFAGFSYLNRKRSFARLSGLTFYIYLIHAGLLNAVMFVLKKSGGGTYRIRKSVFRWELL